MSTNTTDLNAAVKAQAEEIVTSAADVRSRLAEVVAQNAWQSQQSGEGGLVGLIRAAMDGAQAGLARTVPEDRDDVLRQVVNALGDGLSQTSLAGQMALEEAAKSCRRYTTEDLKRFSEDLLAVHDLFSETVERGLTTCKALTTAQVAAARMHIDRVAERLRTELEVLNDLIREHPEAFARQGLGQCAAGALFQDFDRMRRRAGDVQRRESKPADERFAPDRQKP